MLYPTQNQPLLFLVLIIVGFLCGILFDLGNLICTLAGRDKYAHHITYFLATTLTLGILFIVNLFMNYGQFRAFVIIVFVLSLILERLISKFLWTKLVQKCYSIFNKRKGAKIGQKEKD